MERKCNRNLRKALILAEEILKLADEGDLVRRDVGCGVLYGTMRDSGYKIRTLAQAELKVHQARKSTKQQPSTNPVFGHA
ncbi:MAG: hypothetical protein JXD22_09245 [Sedimentisphaerales bacterium]|nr:hypothetical protein [Sedimentisphaerales bacterium]